MLETSLILPPTQDELPSDDGMPMETARHRQQMTLLIEQLVPRLIEGNQGYVGGNMFIYFSLEQVRNQDFRGPDFYAVLGVSNKERKSWVVWEEGKGPDVIIELISDSTRETDKTTKKDVYQNRLRVPEYFWFDPFDAEDLAGFSLQKGIYEALPFDGENRLISQQLGLSLVRWQGIYQGVEAIWLRWANLEGELLPISEEIANQAEQKATVAEQKATVAEQKAAKMAAQLRAMGVEPDDL